MVSGEPGVRASVVGWIVRRILQLANGKVNVAELQRRHGAMSGKLIRMRVSDVDLVRDFRVLDGRLELVEGGAKADGGFEVSSDVLIGLAMGKRRRRHPGTGLVEWVEYTPLDAVTHGEVKFWGEAATNDVLLFARSVYGEIAPKMRELSDGLATQA